MWAVSTASHSIYPSGGRRVATMDEALEVAEVVADSPLEGAVVWLLRLLGALAILAGLGLWLLTDAGLLVLPALLVVVGVVLVVAPSVLLALAELG